MTCGGLTEHKASDPDISIVRDRPGCSGPVSFSRRPYLAGMAAGAQKIENGTKVVGLKNVINPLVGANFARNFIQ